jgi:hypothetical protein
MSSTRCRRASSGPGRRGAADAERLPGRKPCSMVASTGAVWSYDATRRVVTPGIHPYTSHPRRQRRTRWAHLRSRRYWSSAVSTTTTWVPTWFMAPTGWRDSPRACHPYGLIYIGPGPRAQRPDPWRRRQGRGTSLPLRAVRPSVERRRAPIRSSAPGRPPRTRGTALRTRSVAGSRKRPTGSGPGSPGRDTSPAPQPRPPVRAGPSPPT